MKSSLKISDTLGLLWGAGDLKYPTFVPSELARVPRKCKSDLGNMADKNINFDQKAENNLDSGGVDRKEGQRFLEGQCPVHVWHLPTTSFYQIVILGITVIL